MKNKKSLPLLPLFFALFFLTTGDVAKAVGGDGGNGGAAYQQCVAEGGTPNACQSFYVCASGYIMGGNGNCIQTSADSGDDLCTTNAECIADFGAAYVCDQVTKTCEERGTGVDVNTSNGDVCFTDSECSWYAHCVLGSNGVQGTCQTYGTGGGSGSDCDSSSSCLFYNCCSGGNSGGGAGGTGGRSGGGLGSGGCEQGFEKLSGVCFPTTASTGLSSAPVESILGSLLSWLFGIFSIAAIGAFVISGIQYLAVVGDEDMIEKAKMNVKWSIIGIIVGLSGFIIMQAVDTALSGTSSFF